MRIPAIATLAFALASCGGPTWPSAQFPADVQVKRTLFAGGGGGFRETCEAIIVELTQQAVTRLRRVERRDGGLALVPPAGWSVTPIRGNPAGHAYYEGAFGGCDASGGPPLGDLPGALTRPGSFYKVVNGGEGIAIIVPAARLAGYFYFG